MSTAEADSVQLARLYDDFAVEHLVPLWTQIADLMPAAPAPRAAPHV